VIVVSADSGQGLRDCVHRVLACSTSLELLLIDNASADGVPQALARAYEHEPRFHLMQNHGNLGFGPAANRAAAQAKGRPDASGRRARRGSRGPSPAARRAGGRWPAAAPPPTRALWNTRM